MNCILRMRELLLSSRELQRYALRFGIILIFLERCLWQSIHKKHCFSIHDGNAVNSRTLSAFNSPPTAYHARQGISRRKAYRFATGKISRPVRDISRRKVYRFATGKISRSVRSISRPSGHITTLSFCSACYLAQPSVVEESLTPKQG